VLLPAVVTGVLVLAALGFALGRSTADETATAGVTARALASGPVSVTVPGGWAKAKAAPTVLARSVEAPLELAPAAERTAAGLVVGQTKAGAPTFVPASLRQALPAHALEKRERVRLGALEAFRYRGLTPRGLDGRLTLYVVPQEKRSPVLQCFVRRGAPASLLDECESIAATATVRGAKPVSLAPSAQYATLVSGALRTLQGQRDTRLRTLRRAPAQVQQAAAADALARAYRLAAGKLTRAPVNVVNRSANRELIGALAAAKAAYEQLGVAARRDDRTRYDAARRRIAQAERRIDGALVGLRKLGYTVA
jgi:hypothetical protein